MHQRDDERENQFVGCLLGTAVGDSIGLAAERLSAAQIARRWPKPLQQSLLFGYGCISDDTEHAYLTARCLALHGQDVSRFRRALASRLRWWFVALPAGTGMATARACIRLWCGMSPSRSGVWSAGNGPTMRAAIIGLYAAENPQLRNDLLVASTVMTHHDPKAFTAASALAETAAWLVGDRQVDIWDLWKACGTDEDWQNIMCLCQQSFLEKLTVAEYAQRLGCTFGVSAYAYQSVPVTLYAWLVHRQDPRKGLESLVRCGGDTDTMAAGAGALYGIELGPERLPPDWLADIIDWPMSIGALRQCGVALAKQQKPGFWWWICQPVRNVLFLVLVVLHGFRRLWPW